MSNDNTTANGSWEKPVVSAARGTGKLAADKTPKREVEVMSFEIADDDLGGDPYNHTGTHCVLKIDENS